MNTQKQKILFISLVMPCLNEEEAVAETVQKARLVFDSMDLKDYEIILSMMVQLTVLPN